MNEEQLRDLLQMADRRDAKRYEWLRYLLLLAAGALTLLVSLKTDSTGSRIAVWSLRLAWPALGLGILLLGLALHGEVWRADALVKRTAAAENKTESAAGPIIAKPPAIYARAERAAYAALATTVVALVLHGVCR